MNKKRIAIALVALMIILACFVACDTFNGPCKVHIDRDKDGFCDICGEPVKEGCKIHIDANGDNICDSCDEPLFAEDNTAVDFYSVNDLHGKYLDTDEQPGVDNLTTYFKQQKQNNQNTFFLSLGDMWQGSAESNSTHGALATEWMNEIGFSCMVYGNHEFDWGEDAIRENVELAEFPFLAINIYERDTNTLADYCEPSLMLTAGEVQIGVIGAIGDCYSSISADKTRDIYFKTGAQLSRLVKDESTKLRNQGADYIVFAVHDGYDAYDESLSNGYVDLVFEGHTHSSYKKVDKYGVHHLQGGGENKGISHARVVFDETETAMSISAQTIPNRTYANYAPDDVIDRLVEKYRDQIGDPNAVIGYNSRYRSSNELCETVARLYYETGIAEWGNQYPIVLGGGFLRARSPYDIPAGDVTYAMLFSIFPFDNEIQLCSVKGDSLRDNFFFTSNNSYHIYYGSYGAEVQNSIDPTATYYIIVDSYTSQYAPNRLTVIASYTFDVMARDLLKQYVADGNWA